MIIRKILFFISFVINSSLSNSGNMYVIKTNGTTIIGKKLNTVFDKKPYAAFWKIPYAQRPVHKLRFQVGFYHSSIKIVIQYINIL